MKNSWFSKCFIDRKGEFILYAVFILFNVHCQSIYKLYLDVPIVFPRIYYRYLDPIKAKQLYENYLRFSDFNQVIWDQLTLKLYEGSDLLSESVELIKKGEVDQAIRLVQKNLNNKSLSRGRRGRLHNNLGCFYLLRKTPELKKAKDNINQAGILLSSPVEVLDNARMVTFFFQREANVIKKK